VKRIALHERRLYVLAPKYLIERLADGCCARA
jgi:hypothetical protein